MKSTPVSTLRLVTAFVAIAALLGGCSSSYVVQVDAISQPAQMAPTEQPASLPQSYHIRISNPKLDESSLRYKEVENYVKTALSGKGMYEAPRPEKADVVIDIDYGMDAPRVKFETVSNPVYIETGGNTVTRTEQVAIRMPDGSIRMVLVNRQEVLPRTTEFVGMETEIRPVIVYEKYLKVSARANQEASEGRPAAEVWSVNVSAEDKSRELRKYLPILASASADYIGTNTKESKSVKISESDEVVGFIKKGI